MALILKFNQMKIRSFTDPSTWYLVDEASRTCTCGGFASKGTCKHLDALGIYPLKGWHLPANPSFSQALSALVKSIRLRRIDDAVFWCLWLFHRNEEGNRFRLARRLLIGSSEDGHSISVMEKVSSKFPYLARKDSDYLSLVAEVVRICLVENWWHPNSGGRAYLDAGLLGNRQVYLYDMWQDGLQKNLHDLQKFIEEKDAGNAMGVLERINKDGTQGRTKTAQWIHDLASKMSHEPAQRLAAIHLTHRSALSGDANFIGQAVWHMAGGTSPVIDKIEPVLYGETVEKIKSLWDNLSKPAPMAEWFCDGIHCGGRDRRYAGMWPDMVAATNSYNHYGNMDVKNAWKPEFYSREGLILG